MNILSKLYGKKDNSTEEGHRCEDESCSHKSVSCEENVQNILEMAANNSPSKEHVCNGECSHAEKKECCKGHDENRAYDS